MRMIGVTLAFVMALVLVSKARSLLTELRSVLHHSCSDYCYAAGLSHIDDGAASLKANFIHQGFHQVDSTAMAGLDILRSGWVWDVARVKPLSFIPDDDRNFVNPTAAANVHLLPRIFMVAMNDGIRQGLAKCDFYVLLVSRDPLAFPNQVHEGVHEGRDCANFTS
jgi:hypothetical protein